MATKGQQSESQKTKLQEEDVGSTDEELGNLIEVFKPFLLRTLRVSHLLVFLHHIKEVKDVAAMVHKKENSGDFKGATRLLMDAITRSEEKGKWQAFIDALREVEDTIILQTLLEKIPRKNDGWYDHQQNEKLIDLLSNDIQHSLRLEPLLPVMVQEKLIHREDEVKLRNILHNRTTFDANAVLLLIMPRHNENWFHTFLSILYNDEHHRELAKLIDPVYCEKFIENTIDTPSLSSGETVERFANRQDSFEDTFVNKPPSLEINLGGMGGEAKHVRDKSLPPESEGLGSRKHVIPQPEGRSREATCACACCAQVQAEVKALRSEVAEIKMMLRNVLSTVQQDRPA